MATLQSTVQMPAAAADAKSGKRVVFVSRTPIFGGAEKHLLDLVQRLGPPVDPVILCVEDDLFSPRLGSDSRVSVLKAKRSPRFVWQWLKLLRGLRPDVVVFVHGVLATFDANAYIAARLAGAERVHSLHHLIPPAKPARVTGLKPIQLVRRAIGWRTRHLASVRMIARVSDRILCVSEAVRQGLLGEYAYPAGKTVSIYNGVDVAAFTPSAVNRAALREKLKIGAEELVLVCVARLSPMKGIDVLLEALARVRDQLVQDQAAAFRCLLIGDGPLREDVMAAIERLGLAGCVLLEGFQADVRPYLQAADVFILTSHREGLPLSVLEAMACGLPCIVTDVGGNAEAVGHGREGLTIRPGSVEETVNAVLSVLTRREAREEMGARAHARARKVFDLDVRMAELAAAILA